MRTVIQLAMLGFLLVRAADRAGAQTVSTTTGAINGTVTDATSAVLPGVTVTLSGAAVMGSLLRRRVSPGSD